MTKKKVMVNILNQGTIMAGMETQIIMWMQAKMKEYEFKLFFPTDRPIPANRHKIVRDFLKGDWDYLIMLDQDNLCKNNIFDLLDLDLPVVAGVYPGKDEYGIFFHVYRLDSDNPPKFKQYPTNFREGLKKVDAVATGMMVIKREILERFRDEKILPFTDTFNEDGTIFMSDDMGFCLKCKKLGIDVYAHYDYLGSHWKMMDILWVANLVAYAAKTGKTNFPRPEK